MYSFNRFIILVFFLSLLNACASSNPNLSRAEEKVPVKKVHVKLRKYIEKLYSDDAKDRAWAVYNIGKAHKFAVSTVPYLVAMLGDNSIAVMNRNIGKNYTTGSTTTPADEAVRALAKIGQSSVKPLLAVLNESDIEAVLKAIKTLGLLRDNEAIKPLAKFLSHEDKRIRLEAANSLSRYRNPWVADYLLKALQSKSLQVRSTALYAIGKRKNPVTIPTLIKLLDDPDITIRSQVLHILGGFRDERIVKPLLSQLNTSDINFRLEVISALANVRDYRVIEKLIALLRDDDKKIQVAAAESLSQIADVSIGVNYSKWNEWWQNKIKRAAKN